jgi:hypothetical protein
MGAPEPTPGWAWFDGPGDAGAPSEEICRSAVVCLGGPHGRVLLRHLRQLFSDRRLSPAASDAELRHLLQLLERGSGRTDGLTPTPPALRDLP